MSISQIETVVTNYQSLLTAVVGYNTALAPLSTAVQSLKNDPIFLENASPEELAFFEKYRLIAEGL